MSTARYDYVAATPTRSRALPTEGAHPRPLRVADLMRDDVAIADLHERIADVRPRVHASPYAFALVTGRGGVLLGRLRRAVLEGDPTATAAQVMEPGPSTVRPTPTPPRSPAAEAERLRRPWSSWPSQCARGCSRKMAGTANRWTSR
jgi:hypothetical protein